MAELLRALRAVRQARPSEARPILERDTVLQPLVHVAATITREELLALATTKPLTEQALRKVLTAELALERALADQPAAAPPAEGPAPSWSQSARPGGLDPLPSLELLNLTTFDPRACVFRDGKWVVP
jgi:hypothetical protein